MVLRPSAIYGPHDSDFLPFFRAVKSGVLPHVGRQDIAVDLCFVTDLVHGLVEVVPTAHYMMGGVVFGLDCMTELPGLFAAGEDTGGVHGANRLGGNGVANSTVFGGIAGDTLAKWTPKHGKFRDPDEAAIETAVAECRTPLAKAPGDLEEVRNGLATLMWDDAGIVRDQASLGRALAGLDSLDKTLDGVGVDGRDLAYNLAWHDWLNHKNLILVSR